VAVAIALLGGLVIAAVLFAAARPVAVSSPTPTATATSSPTPTSDTRTTTPAAATLPTVARSPAPECVNAYIAGERPIVAPRKSGAFAEIALDVVKVGPSTFGNTTRWLVRAFDPTGSPGTFELPLRASVRTAAGTELNVVGYEAGPPNAGSERTSQTVVIHPCDPAAAPGSPQRGKVVLIVHTAPISSGQYTLTLRDLKLPEGGTREESWAVTLTCSPSSTDPSAIDCR
jgi:hypothetical protein